MQFEMDEKPARGRWLGWLPQWHCMHATALIATLLLAIAGVLLWVYHPDQVGVAWGNVIACLACLAKQGGDIG